MAKEKLPPPPPDDIPAWFMTYSDVITLLMTFFILLLTFSTTEPERFEKVQTAVHQSGGASSMVGPVSEGIDQGLLGDSYPSSQCTCGCSWKHHATENENSGQKDVWGKASRRWMSQNDARIWRPIITLTRDWWNCFSRVVNCRERGETFAECWRIN